MNCTECKEVASYEAANKTEDFAAFNFTMEANAIQQGIAAKLVGFVRVSICKECIIKKQRINAAKHLTDAKVSVGMLTSIVGLLLMSIISIASGHDTMMIFGFFGIPASLILIVSGIRGSAKRKTLITKSQKEFDDAIENNFDELSLLTFFPALENIKTEVILNTQDFTDFSDISKTEEYINSSKAQKNIYYPSEEVYRKYIAVNSLEDEYVSAFKKPYPSWIGQLYAMAIKKLNKSNI